MALKCDVCGGPLTVHPDGAGSLLPGLRAELHHGTPAKHAERAESGADRGRRARPEVTTGTGTSTEENPSADAASGRELAGYGGEDRTGTYSGSLSSEA